MTYVSALLKVVEGTVVGEGVVVGTTGVVGVSDSVVVSYSTVPAVVTSVAIVVVETGSVDSVISEGRVVVMALDSLVVA